MSQPMKGPKPPTTGDCIYHARKALRLGQAELARRARVSARTVSRWENNDHLPPASRRAHLLATLGGAPAHLVDALANALGVAPPATGAAEGAFSPVAQRDLTAAAGGPAGFASASPLAHSDATALRAALDRVLYAGADDLDVSPRRLRAVVVDVLGELDRLAVTPKQAREALAQVEPPKPPSKSPGAAVK